MPSTNACNLCLTRLQDIFLRSRNCWGGLYPLRNMCHNVSQNIFAPHFRVGEERHIWWLDYLWPASQPTCLRSCLSAYDQCHPPTLSHGHASAITKLTLNSRSASLTKLLLQNKENIMSTLSLVFKSLSGQEVFQPLSILAESVTTSFPVVKVVNFRDWAITLQKKEFKCFHRCQIYMVNLLVCVYVGIFQICIVAKQTTQRKSCSD